MTMLPAAVRVPLVLHTILSLFGLSSMLGSRGLACLLLLALLPNSGCGGSSQPTKGYNHLVAASQALEAGDKDTAMTELTASIDTAPNAWAYFERARLHLEQGQESEATADCQKGLELDPSNTQIKWLMVEMKKPVAQRFKGRFAKPPLR